MAIQMHLASYMLPAILAANLLAFAAFGWDKRQARGGGRRVKESTLLGLALIGGTPAAFAGRTLFRHKTRKQPFVAKLYRIAAFQIAACAAAGWTLLR